MKEATGTLVNNSNSDVANAFNVFNRYGIFGREGYQFKGLTDYAKQALKNSNYSQDFIDKLDEVNEPKQNVELFKTTGCLDYLSDKALSALFFELFSRFFCDIKLLNGFFHEDDNRKYVDSINDRFYNRISDDNKEVFLNAVKILIPAIYEEFWLRQNIKNDTFEKDYAFNDANDYFEESEIMFAEVDAAYTTQEYFDKKESEAAEIDAAYNAKEYFDKVDSDLMDKEALDAANIYFGEQEIIIDEFVRAHTK